MLTAEKFLFPIWVEIDVNALINNLKVIRSIVAKGTKIMGVVKFNAYGHGAVKVAQVLADEGIDALGVNCVEEGIELRDAGIKVPIIILAKTSPERACDVVRHNLTPMVCGMDFATELDASCQRAQKKQGVHIRVDTSDSGIGVKTENFGAFIKEIMNKKHIVIDGVFSHLLSAYCGRKEDFDKEISRFEGALALFEQVCSQGKSFATLIHAGSSPAVFRFPENHYSMVRVGTSLYGLPSYQGQDMRGLKPVMQIKTRILNSGSERSCQHSGYTGVTLFKEKVRSALIPVGYGHAPYLLSIKNASVLVRGKKVPVLGKAFMGHMFIDVTRVPDAQSGDEVVMLGRQGNQIITAPEVAANCGFDIERCESVCLLPLQVRRLYQGLIRHSTFTGGDCAPA